MISQDSKYPIAMYYPRAKVMAHSREEEERYFAQGFRRAKPIEIEHGGKVYGFESHEEARKRGFRI